MFEVVSKFVVEYSSTREFWLILIAITPIMLIYVGVLIYLLVSICRTACEKKQDSKPTTIPCKGDSRLDSSQNCLIQSVSDDDLCEFQRSTGKGSPVARRQSAQSALSEAVRRQDLCAVKSSLRKTSKSALKESLEAKENVTPEKDLIELDSLPRPQKKHYLNHSSIGTQKSEDETYFNPLGFQSSSVNGSQSSRTPIKPYPAELKGITEATESTVSTKTTYFGTHIVSMDDSDSNIQIEKDIVSSNVNPASSEYSTFSATSSTQSAYGGTSRQKNENSNRGNYNTSTSVIPLWTEVYLGEV